MESNGVAQYDLNYAMQLLLDIAHEQSLNGLLQKFIRTVLERSQLHPARVQVWLIDKESHCAACSPKPAGYERPRFLYLLAGGGNSFSNPGVLRFDDATARMPLGTGLIGKVAASGQQLVLSGLDKRYGELNEFDWLEREHIQGFSGSPITFQGEVLGVIASFTRENIPDGARPWGQIFADHIGATIANARAFEEIQRLKAQLEQQNAYLQEEVVEAKAFGDLVGQSAPLRQLISQVDLVAPTEASVLILGQTGTGKDLVAHEIHRRSPRKDRPLVRVNCASIPKDLFESEFFGHVKGAFTGAIEERAGRFETAEGGTLFLDEIGEVPLEMQSKLLRVLQEKHYERVGNDRTRHADVRIIAATNRDLKKEVAVGRFREDLYYRLNVFPIHVTTLKERMDDIPLLAKYFVELSVKELRCAKPRLTQAAVATLQNYAWPGNIRELRNVIERAVILAHGGVLHFDLPTTHSVPITDFLEQNHSGQRVFTEAEMRSHERENLIAALEQSGWKVKGPDGAAEFLGVKPTTLLARMKNMRLSRPEPD